MILICQLSVMNASICLLFVMDASILSACVLDASILSVICDGFIYFVSYL